MKDNTKEQKKKERKKFELMFLNKYTFKIVKYHVDAISEKHAINHMRSILPEYEFVKILSI